MKKLFAFVFTMLFVVSAAACSPGAGTPAAKNVEGTLSELLAKIYENADVEGPMTYEIPLTPENTVSMIGTDEVKYKEGLGSEAMIMSVPHSMILLRMEDNADIAAAKSKIKETIDPRKWICVGVDPEQVIVDSIGDLVFVVMSYDAEAYHQAFLKLAE